MESDELIDRIEKRIKSVMATAEDGTASLPMTVAEGYAILRLASRGARIPDEALTARVAELKKLLRDVAPALEYARLNQADPCPEIDAALQENTNG